MKIKYILFILVGLLFSTKVYANDIKKITMDIYVDNNGNAHVVEEWTANVTDGTEGYKPYYNLGTSKIINYKVSMDGTYFKTQSSWNVAGSFDDKKYKSGLNKIDDGYELCFGISRYGNNIYKLEYTITNFVVGVDDADMIYWQLIPNKLSDKPEYVSIKIYSDFKYNSSWDVWGFGNYGGYAYIHEDGYIELIRDKVLKSNEYMTALVKFPKGTFNTETILDDDFEDYLEMAKEGSTTYTEEKFSISDCMLIIFEILISFVPTLLIIFGLCKNINIYGFGTKSLKFGKGTKKLGEVPYFRDLPCNKDIFKAYWVACQYNLIKNKTDFLGAILLRWLKDGHVQNVTIESKNLKKEERAIKLLNKDNMSLIEIELYDMMYESSLDGVLESHEFTKWCKKNDQTILNWFNKVIDNVTMDYVADGLITEEKGKWKNTYFVNDIMKEDAIKMAGLRKFLNEFSNIKDRESIEVMHWEEYLMYAQIFGIAKKVAKEFKKLYPDLITEEYYNDIIFIHHISYKGVSAANEAREQALNYSSGGGGFSAGGGGGGSFGGGGGGGGFR